MHTKRMRSLYGHPSSRICHKYQAPGSTKYANMDISRRRRRRLSKGRKLRAEEASHEPSRSIRTFARTPIISFVTVIGLFIMIDAAGATQQLRGMVADTDQVAPEYVSTTNNIINENHIHLHTSPSFVTTW